jgi:PAS domain S-box-containing protein
MAFAHRDLSPPSELWLLVEQLMAAGAHPSPEAALRSALERSEHARPALGTGFFTTVLDSMRDPFYALDREWRYTYLNKAAEFYYERPRETMIGQVIWDAFSWARGAALKARYEQVMRSRQPMTFETQSVPRPERYFEVHLFPLGDGMGVSFRDRTERRQAEDALRASEARYRLAVDAGHLAVCECDLRSRTLKPSRELNQLLGFGPDEVLCLSKLRARAMPEEWDRLRQLGERALAQGDRFVQAELRFQRGDGVWRWLMLRAELHFDERQAPTRLIGVLLDITERKQADEALRESEARLTAAADNMPLSMVYQVASSRDGRNRNFIYVSRSCEAVNGIAPEDALGDPSTLYALVPPDHVPALIAAETEALETLTPVDVEIPMRHAVTGEERWYRLISSPRLLPDGSLIWDGVQIDVTERKRATEAVRASEERLRTVLEQMPVGVMMARIPTGEPLFHNAKTLALLGREPWSAQKEGPRRFGAIHPDGRPYAGREYPIIRTIRSGDVVDREELIYRRQDGRILNLAVSSAPVVGDGESFAVSTLYDITESKRAEEHLRLLVNELNHRVKNTLATVQSIAAQSFRGLEGSNETGGVALARSAFEARLFALARAHDVLTRENWEGAGLRAIAMEAVAPYRGRTARTDPFILEGPDLRMTPKVALSLSMALHELCTNAVKYGALSRRKGRVHIRWAGVDRPDGPCLSLRWEERGGPPVVPPSRKGFGSRMIERSLARELAGDVVLAYEPAGLICTIRFPLNLTV